MSFREAVTTSGRRELPVPSIAVLCPHVPRMLFLPWEAAYHAKALLFSGSKKVMKSCVYSLPVVSHAIRSKCSLPRNAAKLTGLVSVFCDLSLGEAEISCLKLSLQHLENKTNLLFEAFFLLGNPFLFIRGTSCVGISPILWGGDAPYFGCILHWPPKLTPSHSKSHGHNSSECYSLGPLQIDPESVRNRDFGVWSEGGHQSATH